MYLRVHNLLLLKSISIKFGDFAIQILDSIVRPLKNNNQKVQFPYLQHYKK